MLASNRIRYLTGTAPTSGFDKAKLTNRFPGTIKPIPNPTIPSGFPNSKFQVTEVDYGSMCTANWTLHTRNCYKLTVQRLKKETSRSNLPYRWLIYLITCLLCHRTCQFRRVRIIFRHSSNRKWLRNRCKLLLLFPIQEIYKVYVYSRLPARCL